MYTDQETEGIALWVIDSNIYLTEYVDIVELVLKNTILKISW